LQGQEVKQCHVINIDTHAILWYSMSVDAIYQRFGLLLRDLRKRAGLTQEELGGRVNLTRTSITNIEQGRQNVALHQFFEFANALGVPPATLLPTGVTREEIVRNLDPKNADLILKLGRRNSDETHRGKGANATRTVRTDKGSD